MSSTTSGRVLTRFSLQPSSAAPPKSAAERLRCCSMVPIAPSSTRMRSASSSRRAFSDSFRFLILPCSLPRVLPYLRRAIPNCWLSFLFYLALAFKSNPLSVPLSRRCRVPNPPEKRPKQSVTTREHLFQRPLPLLPGFTTLRYSGNETHVSETHCVPAIAAPIGVERIRTSAVQSSPIQGHSQAVGVHAGARSAQP